MVKYAVDSLCSFGEGAYEEYTPDRSWDNCRALALAISGGHVEVVDALLHGSAPCWVWDINGAFEQALKEGHEDIAWSIYETFRDRLSRYGDVDLIVQMVRDGHTHAVKSLCKTDFGIELIGDALIAAVQAAKPKIVEFLLGTGRVPPDTIDWAFEEAARYGSIDAVKLLYSHRRISQQAISKAFEFVGSLVVVNFLYDMDHISLDALAAAFERVTQPTASPRSEDDPPDMSTEDRVEIIKLLCDTGCIPSELISKAFVRAARKGYTNVMEALHDDECVDSMATAKAFICACYHGHTAIVKVLCGKEGLSSDTVARSLEVAASRGHTGIVELLSRTQRLAPVVVAELVEKEAIVGSTHLIKGLHTQEHLYLDAITDGLVNAATKGWGQVGAVCNGQELSCEVICEVFVKAAGRGCLVIVQNLFREPHITCAIKHEAFIKASRHGQTEVMKFFDTRASWSLETLNQALEVTRDLDILHYLCKKIGEALARNVNKTKEPKRRRNQ